MNKSFRTGKQFAGEMDSRDPLADMRNRFYIPENTIYMDGNSLGLASMDAEKKLQEALQDWKTLAIRGWLDAKSPWFYLPEKLGAKMAELVGAQPEEVVMTGSTTGNLHSMVSTFYKPWEGRTKIIADTLNFPSDIYALRSQVMLHGLDPEENLVLVESRDGKYIDEDDVIKYMDETVSLVLLPGVLYRSGQLLDMKRLTSEAHKRGIIIGFDCAHSAGAVPHYFDNWDVDFAFWCSYKHLNGGPGSPAFIYLNKRHFNREPGLAGWFGCKKEKQFDLSIDFDHANSAGGWQMGTPSVFSAAALEGSLDISCEAGIEKIREKSLELTSYLIFLVENTLSDAPYNYTTGTPLDTDRRGGHVAVIHPQEAWRICCALKDRNIIPDFRPDSVIRLAPCALYNTFTDVWNVAEALREILDHKEYEKFSVKRDAVS